MVAVIVFAAHGLAAIYAFITRFRQGGPSEGILAVAFLAIIFSVGWTILTMITGLVFEPAGFSKLFNRDAITLTLLTICEGFFYFFFLRKQEGKVSGAKGNDGSTT